MTTRKEVVERQRMRLIVSVLNLLMAEQMLDGRATSYAAIEDLKSAVDFAALGMTDAMARLHPRDRPMTWNHGFTLSGFGEKNHG